MISSLDVPACSACGSREVHPVTRVPDRSIIEKLSDDIAGEEPAVQTLFACRGCGRDQTDAWAPLQIKPEPVPVIGRPDPVPEPPDPLGLGVGATLKAST